MVLGPYYQEQPCLGLPHCGEEWHGYRDPNSAASPV